MFLLEIDSATLLELGVALIGTGTLASGVIFGVKAVKRIKGAFEGEKSWTQIAKELWDAGKDMSDEAVELARQVKALSKAVQDKDSAVERINNNSNMRKKLVEMASSFSEEDQVALAQVLTPVKAGIRHYAGIDTDKLAALKDAMENDLSAQETRNRIMTSSGQMAALIAKTAVSVIPTVLTGGRLDLSKVLGGTVKKTGG